MGGPQKPEGTGRHAGHRWNFLIWWARPPAIFSKFVRALIYMAAGRLVDPHQTVANWGRGQIINAAMCGRFINRLTWREIVALHFVR